MIKSTVVHKEKDSIGDLKKVEVHSDELLQKDTEKIGRRQDGYGVHPVLYNIYKFTQVTMRFFYVFWWILMMVVSMTTIIDSLPFQETGNLKMFYMAELIKKKILTKPFTTSGMTFMDIEEVDDVWLWLDQIFVPYLAPDAMSFSAVSSSSRNTNSPIYKANMMFYI